MSYTDERGAGGVLRDCQRAEATPPDQVQEARRAPTFGMSAGGARVRDPRLEDATPSG
jgi:hypothetical protein